MGCRSNRAHRGRGNRKGVVEKANHTAAQRWWRTLPDDITVADAQARLDQFCATVGDTRDRVDVDGNRCTVADLAARERLAPLPATAFPAELAVERVVVSAGVGLVPREPVLRAARAGQRAGHRDPPPRLPGAGVRHRPRRDSSPASPGRRRHRRHYPQRAPRHRTEQSRAGRVHHRQTAPPQTAHPTRPGRPARRTGVCAAPPPHPTPSSI